MLTPSFRPTPVAPDAAASALATAAELSPLLPLTAALGRRQPRLVGLASLAGLKPHPWLLALGLAAVPALAPAAEPQAQPPGLPQAVSSSAPATAPLALPAADPLRIDLQLGGEHAVYEDRIDGRTSLQQLPLVARLRQGRWLLQAQYAWVSWRREATPQSVAAGAAPTASASGWGDAWYKASWELQEITQDRTGLDLTVKFKDRNGDTARSLGSGRRDLALQLEAMQLWSRDAVFGHLGVRRSGADARLGSSDTTTSTTTSHRGPRVYGELGLQHPLAPGWVSGAFYDVQTPTGSLGPLSELTAYGAYTRGPVRWELHLARGFNQASARFGIGGAMRYRF